MRLNKVTENKLVSRKTRAYNWDCSHYRLYENVYVPLININDKMCCFVHLNNLGLL